MVLPSGLCISTAAHGTVGSLLLLLMLLMLVLLLALQEMNDHDETCRFIQVWLTPDTKAPGYGQPKYGSTHYTKADRHNQLLHMLSGTGPTPAWPAVNSSKAPIQLYQDGNVFVSESDAGVAYELQLAAQRQAYILCMEGAST
jgi:redox-sensitive bicupin YhaK (pirin superfamily)